MKITEQLLTDVFNNTKLAAERIRKVESPSLDKGFEQLFAAILSDNAESAKQDIDYVIGKLYNLR